MEEGPIAEEEKKGGNNEKKREGKKREEESSIKDCNFDLYCPVRVLRTGPPCYRYADRPLLGTIAKIDRRRSIEGEIGRRRSIEGKKGKKKKKRKRRKEGRRKKYLTPSLPADRPWAVAALARTRFFSRARRRNVSPCGEKDRGDARRGPSASINPLAVRFKEAPPGRSPEPRRQAI
ncbi:hypothetical protein BHE74_00053403 [Ensete ventricosum]|nr:hypothetical protein BHE74_00053403 [Ensete ventricosum]RZS22777.1 hypothetical protein BHM03_00055603 [Ensete ventricosum]